MTAKNIQPTKPGAKATEVKDDEDKTISLDVNADRDRKTNCAKFITHRRCWPRPGPTAGRASARAIPDIEPRLSVSSGTEVVSASERTAGRRWRRIGLTRNHPLPVKGVPR